MRMIDADAAKNEFWALMKELTKATVEPLPDNAIGALAGYSIIENAPTVDAVPVIHAHWEEEPNNERHWHCSNCGTGQDTACIIMNYCPHCGARMAEHPWLADGTGQAFSPD